MEKWYIIYNISILIILLSLLLGIIRLFFISACKICYKGDQPLKYIPKKIFQILLDNTNINPKFIDNIEYIKSKNPDWTYRIFHNADIVDYIKLHYSPEILEYYKRINPSYGAARADFFRYLLMYREGGVYLDIKSAPTIPLNNIIGPDDEYILSHYNFPVQNIYVGLLKGEYQQWHIICRPEHPYLKAVIERVIGNIKNYSVEEFGVGKSGVLRVTGPIAYTLAISPIRNNYRCRLTAANEILGLRYNNTSSIINPMSHVNMFSKTHYSKIKEPIIIKNEL